MSTQPKIDDGGPAFPVPNDANMNGQEGMTLRQHFAGLAMQGLLARSPDGYDCHYESTARVAVAHADALIAMLKARQ